MLIESNLAVLIESLRNLQTLVQDNPASSSSMKIKSLRLLNDAENAIDKIFKLNRYLDKTDQLTNLEKDTTTRMSAVTSDVKRSFTIVNNLEMVKLSNKKINFIKNNDNNQLVQNKFTKKKGHIRVEFGNNDKLYYIVQYEDGSYNTSVEENFLIL